MNKKKYLVATLAALMMAGCSDDITENTGGGALSGETAYVKVSINLPTAGPSTRTTDDGLVNDNFDDGTANEYSVGEDDAYLLIFQGADEESATLQSWYQVQHQFDEVGSTTDNVTSSSEVVQQISRPSGTGKTYAFVVLNPNGNLTFSGPIEGIDNAGTTITMNSASVTSLSGLRGVLVKDASAFTTKSGGESNQSFTMMNAPLSDEPGSNLSTEQTVTTLVPITVYDTQEEAEYSYNPDQIYVERVVAKVTVDYTSGVFTKDDAKAKYYATISSNNSYNGDRVYLDSWYLNVTNKSTKFLHDVGSGESAAWKTWAGYGNATTAGSQDNRFFGNSSPFRVYWAIDPNYDNLTNDKTSLKAAFNVYDAESTNIPEVSGENIFGTPQYCLENTFTAEHMNQRETTGIVFKMTYLFDANQDPKTFFVMGDEETANPEYAEGFVEAVNEALDEEFDVALIDNPKGGYYQTVDEIASLFTVNGSPITDASQKEAISVAVGNIVRVYENGTTYYYAARIKHFGDYYCPIANGSVDSSKDYDEEKHLGRYGVVRNNWYEIVINSISGPGRPTPPDPTDPDDPDNPKPDDPAEEGWIDVNVNVLSWAKREQSVDL